MITVFADIDGVLNQLQPWKIDKGCIKVLEHIFESFECDDIILISSWRKGWHRDINMCTPQVKQLIKELNSIGLKIIGRTGELGDRAKEIEDYCKRHKIDKYITLDDDIELFKSLHDRTKLYIVNSKTGLTNNDVKRIKKAI